MCSGTSGQSPGAIAAPRIRPTTRGRRHGSGDKPRGRPPSIRIQPKHRPLSCREQPPDVLVSHSWAGGTGWSRPGVRPESRGLIRAIIVMLGEADPRVRSHPRGARQAIPASLHVSPALGRRPSPRAGGSPAEVSPLQCEPCLSFDKDDQMVAKALLDALILKHQARRWASAS